MPSTTRAAEPPCYHPGPMHHALTTLRPLVVAAAFGASLALAAPVAPAASPATNAVAVEPADQVRAALGKRFPTLRIESLRAAPVAGLWEFTVGMDVYYVSSDARFIVRGDIVDLAGDRNLSEQRRAELRRAQLGRIAEADMIVFGPPRATHTVTVFTDIDCGYCRKLHSQIAEYNRLGIRVRYLPYPRAGLGSESWQKAKDVWCAKDRNTALTRAKRDEAVPHAECDGAVVMRGLQLGELFKLDGTPMVLSDDGFEIGGYLTPTEMKQRLDLLTKQRPRG